MDLPKIFPDIYLLFISQLTKGQDILFLAMIIPDEFEVISLNRNCSKGGFMRICSYLSAHINNLLQLDIRPFR